VKSETHPDFPDRIVVWTESFLTHRARRIEKKKRKQKRRGIVMEWIDAFLWAVMVVLLLNQYLLQAYQIPSGSMRHTLIGGLDPYTGRRSSSDRIFVDKLTFGPELLPGVGKLPGFREPRRSEVIIFENPEYQSPSLGHEIAQRVLYMVTLSMVDLNRRGGDTAHQFLIKRQVAQDGDRVLFERGELYVQPRGESELMPEGLFKEYSSLDYGNQLLLDPGYYNKLDATIRSIRMERAGLAVDRKLAETASANWVSPLKKTVVDIYEEERIDSGILRILYPQNESVRAENSVYERGIYVPEGWVLPLGDNRSDSLDGRYFGPVPSENILGRALFIYWPLARIGGIH
jgi:signal peptidase I